MSPLPFLLCTGLVAGWLVGFAPVAWSGETHSHAGHPGHTAPEPSLNNGKQWPTDPPLRAGMEGIRHDLEAVLPQLHAGTLSGEQSARLAKNVRGHVDNMIRQCKLPPDVDAQLHGVLAEIATGADTLEGKNNPSSGALHILQALDRYGRHFDHPGWRAPAH